MERRVLLAAMLSAIFLAWYSRALLRVGGATPARQMAATPPGQAPRATVLHEAALAPLEREDVVIIESEELALELGNASG